MLDFLPSDDVLYEAFLERDVSFDGRAYVGVTSTGIFCRLSCGARKPKRENCEFYSSAGEAISQGFRACKMCKPVGDGDLAGLVARLQAEPERAWKESDVEAMGLEPKTLRRRFERQYGMSFFEMARRYKLLVAMREIEKGGKVIDAQLAAGFNSAQGFRDAFSEFLGVKPSELRADANYLANWIETPLGAMIAICDEERLHLLEFTDRKNLGKEVRGFYENIGGALGIGRTNLHEKLAEQLDQYFAGQRAQFDLPVEIHADGFTAQVWRALMDIPAGQTRSYGELAEVIGNMKAFRAVANANARNQIAIVIPCHRVIGADGRLSGYAGGVWRKEKLIETERQYQ